MTMNSEEPDPSPDRNDRYNSSSDDDDEGEGDDVEEEDNALYSSTVFGPTCDSMDVISRSVLLPKLDIGDWLYFQNMGAYTCAAASSFNGFTPSKKVYVCSVPPKFFEKIIVGPPDVQIPAQMMPNEEKVVDTKNKNGDNSATTTGCDNSKVSTQSKSSSKKNNNCDRDYDPVEEKKDDTECRTNF